MDGVRFLFAQGGGPLVMLGSVEPVGVGWHYGRKHNRGSREVGTTSRRERSAIPRLETTTYQGETDCWQAIAHGESVVGIVIGMLRFAAVAPQPLIAVDLPVTVAAPVKGRAVFFACPAPELLFSEHPLSAYSHGRHEHGQNFLTDSQVISSLLKRVETTVGPIVEIGPGSGALTRPLLCTGRPLTVVEIDPKLAESLRRVLDPTVTVINDDFLRYRLPTHPHVIVGNIPFHITTALLRRLMRAPAWTDAVLLMQWEVARRRAGVGASTMMTAQWAPWFTFELGERVPRAAFKPRPSVDGGVLHIRRRSTPLVPTGKRKAFHTLVHAVYTGRGRGVVEIVTRAKILPSRQSARAWAERSGVRPTMLPSDLSVEQMVSLFESGG